MTHHHEQTFELADCVHCRTHVVNPTLGECPNCGAEMYPVSKVCQPGTYLLEGGEWRRPDGTALYEGASQGKK